ncbi:MAG: hypothetical protein QXR60_01190, partial [Candidatus Nanoarchaeia archaeon]
MDKRGWMYSYSRTNISLILGFICIAIGVIPLLPYININIPGLTNMDKTIYDVIVKVALLVGGLFLLYDSFQIRSMMTGRVRGVSILAGFLLAVIGILPLALHFKLLDKMLPFIVQLNVPSEVWYGLLIFYGIYLIVDVFRIRQTRFF